MKDIFIYNVEPWLALPVNEEDRRNMIQYCESDDDFANMGISCVSGVHIDLQEREIISTISAPWSAATRDFLRRTVSNPDILSGGFNCSKFDDVLLNHNGFSIQCEFDLLRIITTLAAKAGEEESDLELVYTLDRIGTFNGFPDFKHKQIAPYLYQRNEITSMLSHAQEAALVQATTLLMLLNGELIDPTTIVFLEYEFPRTLTNLNYV